ncbi:MAG TPA: LysM domain-containing protein [Candidatus Binatia bacterium]|nr:LysM domain-containing protein [Candidatus Binatia bacterium]
MKRIFFLLFIFSSLFIASTLLAAVGSQTWKVRPGDNLEIIATTLEISKEEIKNQNPGVLENNLQIGHKLKLPLRSYAESKTLEEELGKKAARIGELEKESGDLAKQLASAESKLVWHPVWLWGFWICFSVIAFIAGGAYWLFRQTHPQVFEQPHERSIRDLRQSQTRVRSTFPHGEEGASSHGGHWQPPLKRLPHGR